MTTKTCYNCHESSSDTITLQKCGQCCKIRYCSTKCQKKDWIRHKLECFQIDKCAICHSNLTPKDFCQTSCGHRFHLTCFLPWNKKSDICPYCRTKL